MKNQPFLKPFKLAGTLFIIGLIIILSWLKPQTSEAQGYVTGYLFGTMFIPALIAGIILKIKKWGNSWKAASITYILLLILVIASQVARNM